MFYWKMFYITTQLFNVLSHHFKNRAFVKNSGLDLNLFHRLEYKKSINNSHCQGRLGSKFECGKSLNDSHNNLTVVEKADASNPVMQVMEFPTFFTQLVCYCILYKTV